MREFAPLVALLHQRMYMLEDAMAGLKQDMFRLEMLFGRMRYLTVYLRNKIGDGHGAADTRSFGILFE